MQKCTYCDRENDDEATACSECGLVLSKRITSVVVTPHRMMRDIQQELWDYFAVKQKRIWLAGLSIGLLAALIKGLQHSENGFPWWMFPAGGAMGAGAVALLVVANKLQARVNQARAASKSVWAWQLFSIVLGLIVLVMAAILVAAIGAWTL